MSKHKRFHGPGGKGGVIRHISAFYQKHPYGTRSGMLQPSRIKKELSNDLNAGQFNNSTSNAASVPSTDGHERH